MVVVVVDEQGVGLVEQRGAHCNADGASRRSRGGTCLDTLHCGARRGDWAGQGRAGQWRWAGSGRAGEGGGVLEEQMGVGVRVRAGVGVDVVGVGGRAEGGWILFFGA